MYLVFFIVYGWNVYEAFQERPVEGFTTKTEIIVTSCPQSEVDPSVRMTAMIAPGTTHTYCYDNKVKICSLSVASDSPDSCSIYYTSLLNSMASKKCPPSMPNFYQSIQLVDNVNKSIRGCTSGERTPDGTSPAKSTDPHCIIYDNIADDLQKLDSCTNAIRLESAKCFKGTYYGVKKNLQPNDLGSPIVQCTVSTPGALSIDTNSISPDSITYTCTDVESYREWTQSIQQLYPDKYSKMSDYFSSSASWDPDKKNTFCSILEQSKIKKTLSEAVVKTVSVL
jgi:hypothetical protein